MLEKSGLETIETRASKLFTDYYNNGIYFGNELDGDGRRLFEFQKHTSRKDRNFAGPPQNTILNLKLPIFGKHNI